MKLGFLAQHSLNTARITLFFDGSNKCIEGLDHEVSPFRRGLREEAAKNMDCSSRKVMKRVKRRSAVVEVGDVVQVPLVQQD